MREIRKHEPVFTWDATLQSEGKALDVTTRGPIDQIFDSPNGDEASFISAPLVANGALVDSQSVQPQLQFVFDDNDIESSIDLALASTVVSSSITDVQSVLSSWGVGEGIGTGDIGDVGCGGCGECGSCNGGGSSNNSGGGTHGLGGGFKVNLDQVVYLDFVNGANGSIDYTQSVRNAVQSQMELIYDKFGVTFVQEAPSSGDFSTLVFNQGSQGGLAEDIDFRNQNKNDNAVINVTGLSSNQSDIISASAVIGAHELGHILGLRHHDAWGPIGSGVPQGLAGFYSPNYPGPDEADETRDHIMNTPALAGQFFDTFSRSWFGEREAIKLTVAANGVEVFESTSPNDTFEDA